MKFEIGLSFRDRFKHVFHVKNLSLSITRMKSFLAFLMLLEIVCLSCSNRTNRGQSEVIAQVNGEEIHSSQVDKLIQQELYDELNRIHSIKNKALNTYIDLKILQQQAEKENLSTDEYSDKYVKRKIEAFGVDSLYNLYKLGGRLRIHGQGISTADKDTLGENLTLKYNLRVCIVQELIDSLKKDSKISKYLYPPKNPTIELTDLLVFYRGKSDAKVTVYIVSDFDCHKCIESHSMYDSLYINYKENVKFGYINFSTIPTLAQIAACAANKQGVFWEYHDLLYNHKEFIDSVAVYNIAKQMNLDVNKFQNDLKDVRISDEIDKTIQKLVERGLFATPTVIVNNRLIYDSNSYDEISHLIEMELKK